ncbi:ATP-binding cassette domain-containing protein [Desulforhopalus singaporensis]|uniref:ABC-type glutathione transport system ATPase component, contains duplicated ATPase domain n=1 Tax=Desulforhopalus singaporensis TaxID=91360 RepID=A0A1H0RL21_9BACT|nr:ATP-binding cassette domain-containing protein [Desulforhopalus singaporensis]SDP30175.1 ABC-type glutathione transport system ATPase component, contains duplicated ATPase domain [Desulforhopalus singaporensis]
MAGLNTGSDNAAPVLTVDRLCYAYPGAASCTLQDISFSVGPGECHLVEGVTGAGKTTLLLAIRGLLPSGSLSGNIHFHRKNRKTLGGPGLVLQNPKTQLLRESLGAEIAFGLENHCVSPDDMVRLVRTNLGHAGLYRPLDYPVDALSMGQQYRICLAGQLAMEPELIMFDEPVAQLDPRGVRFILDTITRLKKSGRSVLICEHRSDIIAPVADRMWRLGCDGILAPAEVGRPVWSGGCFSGRREGGDGPAAGLKDDRVIRVESVKLGGEYGTLELDGVRIDAARGERIALCGPNGSGKTTLIRIVAGLIRPVSGRVEVLGKKSSVHDLRGKVGVLFQDPARQLFETTVFKEVAFAATRIGMDDDKTSEWVLFLLESLGLGNLLDASPHGLSYGQKHLVGLASVLAMRPEVVLLDDPFAGLDHASRTRVALLLADLSSTGGMTVLYTTHDPAIPGNLGDRVVDVAGGGSEPDASGVSPSEKWREKPVSQRRLHLPAGLMFGICMVLSIGAFGAKTPVLLTSLTIANLALVLLLANRPVKLLLKSGAVFLYQSALIVLLYMIRFGPAQGFGAGGLVSWQLFLAFWPGVIFMAANTQQRIVRVLDRIMPQKIAFVSATCLRFLPMLLAEMQQIREMQILRGARIMAVDLKKPRYWPDWLFCLLIPTLIKTLSLAEEIATAATARDFGIYRNRTVWPGE